MTMLCLKRPCPFCARFCAFCAPSDARNKKSKYHDNTLIFIPHLVQSIQIPLPHHAQSPAILCPHALPRNARRAALDHLFCITDRVLLVCEFVFRVPLPAVFFWFICHTSRIHHIRRRLFRLHRVLIICHHKKFYRLLQLTRRIFQHFKRNCILTGFPRPPCRLFNMNRIRRLRLCPIL